MKAYRCQSLILHISFFLLAILIIPFPVMASGAADSTPVTNTTFQPQADQLLALLKAKNPNREHPRLLARSADFANLRARLASKDPRLSSWYGVLKRSGEKMLTQPPETYRLPDGVRLLEISRSVLNRLTTLSLLYQIDKDQKWVDRAWKELAAVCNTDPSNTFQDWHPVHYLDTAEMCTAVALSYDWLYQALDDKQKQTIRDTILHYALEQALPIYRKHNWWADVSHNWNAVCNGGMTLGALAIGDEGEQYGSVSAEVLASAIASVPKMLKEYGPDGGWIEGPGYWAYGTTYAANMIAGLDSALGSDFGLASIQGFSQTADDPIFLTGPKGAFNYADASPDYVKAPVLLWLAGRFNHPDAAVFHDAMAGKGIGGPLDLIWALSGPAASSTAGVERPLRNDVYFRTIEVVGLHSAISKPEDLFVGFKAGNNKANHGDLDLGSFVMDALGERWVLDLGADNYNMPGYFSTGEKGQRWTYYRKRAESHNTLLINPGAGPDQSPSAHASMSRFGAGIERSFAIADLSPAWKLKTGSVVRGIMLYDHKRRVVVQDEIKLEKSSEVYWLLHTKAKVNTGDRPDTLLLSIGNKNMKVQVISPSNAVLSFFAAQPLPNSPDPVGQNKNVGITTIAIHLPEVRETNICVSLEPEDSLGTLEDPVMMPLSAWDSK